jgi:hypothetical protein
MTAVWSRAQVACGEQALSLGLHDNADDLVEVRIITARTEPGIYAVAVVVDDDLRAIGFGESVRQQPVVNLDPLDAVATSFDLAEHDPPENLDDVSLFESGFMGHA